MVKQSNRSISPAALRPGDIILSTDNDATSGLVRWGSNSALSHAMLYLGDGEVLESTANGVAIRPLHEALHDNVLCAVVLRHSRMTPAYAFDVVTYANEHIGAEYDYGGALVSPSRALCGTMGSADKFFCSELIVDAFHKAGLALTNESPQCTTPGDIWNASSAGAVDYIGHLVSYESDLHDFNLNDPGDDDVFLEGSTHGQLGDPFLDTPDDGFTRGQSSHSWDHGVWDDASPSFRDCDSQVDIHGEGHDHDTDDLDDDGVF